MKKVFDKETIIIIKKMMEFKSSKFSINELFFSENSLLAKKYPDIHLGKIQTGNIVLCYSNPNDWIDDPKTKDSFIFDVFKIFEIIELLVKGGYLYYDDAIKSEYKEKSNSESMMTFPSQTKLFEKRLSQYSEGTLFVSCKLKELKNNHFVTEDTKIETLKNSFSFLGYLITTILSIIALITSLSATDIKNEDNSNLRVDVPNTINFTIGNNDYEELKRQYELNKSLQDSLINQNKELKKQIEQMQNNKDIKND